MRQSLLVIIGAGKLIVKRVSHDFHFLRIQQVRGDLFNDGTTRHVREFVGCNPVTFGVEIQSSGKTKNRLIEVITNRTKK